LGYFSVPAPRPPIEIFVLHERLFSEGRLPAGDGVNLILDALRSAKLVTDLDG